MELQDHIFASIDAYTRGEIEHSLHHVCIAVEGATRNFFNKDKVSNKDYKNFVRNYYWIIEPMIGGGINLEETKFSGAKITDGYENLILDPDLADIIYHIFRCSNAHSKAVTSNYQLLPFRDGYSEWIIADGLVQMPERVIWALIAICVFSKGNLQIKTSGEYHLTWGSESLGIDTRIFLIKDWWGKENDFKTFIDKQNILRVTFKNLNFAS